MCRYCHDEVEDHTFNRKTVTELICTECDTRQKVQMNCEKCGIRFGRYTCLICNLFDDDDKSQYHCNSCGICRVSFITDILNLNFKKTLQIFNFTHHPHFRLVGRIVSFIAVHATCAYRYSSKSMDIDAWRMSVGPIVLCA